MVMTPHHPPPPRHCNRPLQSAESYRYRTRVRFSKNRKASKATADPFTNVCAQFVVGLKILH